MIFTQRCGSNSHATNMPTEYIQRVMDMNDWDEETATTNTLVEMTWTCLKRSNPPVIGGDGIPITTEELCRKEILREWTFKPSNT
jgi:hypothetical protein